MPADNRFSRQILFEGLREEGQRRLGGGTALLVGCGALGTHLADLLVRAGIGTLRIVDRDFIEESNLHRQTLFDEEQINRGLPKAIAAAERLRLVYSKARIEPFPEQLDAGNIGRLAAGVQLILDGTDNFETRFLLNDYALKHRLPWIYGACVGAYGLTMNILPGETPCLRCVIGMLPAQGALDTCDTAGVIPPAPAFIAALQATEAIKILAGRLGAVNRDLIVADLWDNTIQRFRLKRDNLSAGCPACDRGDYEYLEGSGRIRSSILCGRNAVQIRPPGETGADLTRLAARLRRFGPLTQNRYLVRIKLDGCDLAVFADGRAIITGTADEGRARALYDRYIGS